MLKYKSRNGTWIHEHDTMVRSLFRIISQGNSHFFTEKQNVLYENKNKTINSTLIKKREREKKMEKKRMKPIDSCTYTQQIVE